MSSLVTNFNFSNNTIGITDREMHFQNFIANTELVSKFKVGFNALLHQGLSESEVYGDLL